MTFKYILSEESSGNNEFVKTNGDAIWVIVQLPFRGVGDDFLVYPGWKVVGYPCGVLKTIMHHYKATVKSAERVMLV